MHFSNNILGNMNLAKATNPKWMWNLHNLYRSDAKLLKSVFKDNFCQTAFEHYIASHQEQTEQTKYLKKKNDCSKQEDYHN